jgi:hypothetical protein
VQQVADQFLACGVLEHGFARIRCDACTHEYLIAFSWQCRDICPNDAVLRLVCQPPAGHAGKGGADRRRRAARHRPRAPPRADRGQPPVGRGPTAALLQPIFAVDPLACPTCQGAMRIVAFITQRSVIDQILTHLRTRATREAHAGARHAPSARPPPPVARPWRHGVQVRAIDITQSAWDHTIELPDARVLVPHDGTVQWRAGAGPVAADDTTTPTTAPHKRAETKAASHTAPVVRLGVRLLRGLGAKARAELERALAHGPFTSVTEFVQRVKLDRASLTHLAECGAFDALFEHEPPARRRRVALWEILAAQRGDDDAQSIAGRITLTGRLP